MPDATTIRRGALALGAAALAACGAPAAAPGGAPPAPDHARPAAPAPADAGEGPARALLAAKPAVEATPRRLVSRADDAQARGRALAASRGRQAAEIAALGVVVVDVPDVAAAIARTRAVAGVAYAEPDYVAHAVLTPNDPRFAQQWAPAKVNLPAAWNLSRGAGVRVAILDTGIDKNHEDLWKVDDRRNFTNSRTDDDQYGHGTHCAGIAAAATNNARGVAGAGFDARLASYKVLGDNGSGSYSGIAAGIVHAADRGAKILSLSLGGGADSQALHDAVDYAAGKGCLVVAAAGNGNTSAPLYPARYDACLAVAATTAADVRAGFSSYGAWVDVAAPGEGVLSTLPNHKNRMGGTNYGTLSGTSMATPLVAGTAALVWARRPAATAAQVRAALESTCVAIPGTGSFWTWGRIDAAAAVAAI